MPERSLAWLEPVGADPFGDSSSEPVGFGRSVCVAGGFHRVASGSAMVQEPRARFADVRNLTVRH